MKRNGLLVFFLLLLFMFSGCKNNNPSDKPDNSNSSNLKITITFYYYEGKEEKILIDKGTKISSPVNPSRDGFSFSGWYSDKEYITQFDFNEEISDNTILYAKWNEEEVVVNYEVNFDTSGANQIDKQIVDDGNKVSRPTDPKKTGYRFAGWYTDENLTNQYDFESIVSANFTLYAKWIKLVNITFFDKDGNKIDEETLDEGSLLAKDIIIPTIEGYTFIGWYIEGTSIKVDLETYGFSENKDLIATYEKDVIEKKISFTSVDGFLESATIEFEKLNSALSYNIYLGSKKLTNNDYYLQDNDGIIRIDLFGLKKGEYQFKVVPLINGLEDDSLANITSIIEVKEYDRSGYAHFKYSDGVGAYNDDGSLKDNAIVIYVTDENKNSVSLTYKDIIVTGIGNILNSVGASCGETGHEDQCKRVSDGKTYYGKGNTNQGILLKLALDNIPLVIRFVGCVSDSGLYKSSPFDASSASLINGLTGYNGYDYGGSVGDNGHMARMKSAKNLTLEGVGDDAIIDGWGFHLICESAYPELAKNFEVRNLTFINTPEDAIGMEGQENESTLTLTAPVQRCWIHHNTFIGPSILSPAESDKAQGDGSCDFKRGRYFTCSYNYFEGCHKTNLVGSSKTSVQFCLSFHHNLWYNCSSRQPLARRANIHFYNNFIYGTTDTVSSLRADAYMFSENNYYLGCSRPVAYNEEITTGVCKAFGNIMVGCYNANDSLMVNSRIDKVASNCQDGSTSYVNFDTNPDLFYYDIVNQRSDCYLTLASDARIDCLAKSGSRYRTVLNKCIVTSETNITNVSSSSIISANTSLSIPKGKGVLKVFTLDKTMKLTIAATSSNGYATGYLLKLDGKMILALSSESQTIILEEGTYVLVSGQSFTGNNNKNDKETLVTICDFALFDVEEYNASLIREYNNLVSLIPIEISYTDECYYAIINVINAYQKLGDLQSQVENKGAAFLDTYLAIGIRYLEGKISNIILPVSSENASFVIDAKRAYDELSKKFNNLEITNLTKLESAIEELNSITINLFTSKVNEIPETISLSDEVIVSEANSLYNMLNDEQKALDSVRIAFEKMKIALAKIANLKEANIVSSLIANANDYDSYKNAYDRYNELNEETKSYVQNVNELLVNYVIAIINNLPDEISMSDTANINKALEIYSSLDEEKKAQVTNYDKLLLAKEALDSLSATVIECTFNGSPSSDKITVSGNYGSTTITIDGTTYTKGLKMESKTSLSFTTTQVSKLTLHVTPGKVIRVDGVDYTIDSSGILVIENLKAGDHSISKNTTNTLLYYLLIE